MKGGVYSRGSVYFKIRDFSGAFIRGGRSFEAGRLFEEIRYIYIYMYVCIYIYIPYINMVYIYIYDQLSRQ